MLACNCGENGKCSLQDGQKSCNCDGGFSEDTDGLCKRKKKKGFDDNKNEKNNQ